MTFADNGRNTCPKIWQRYRVVGRSTALSAAIIATITAIIAAAVVIACSIAPVVMPQLAIGCLAYLLKTGAKSGRRPSGFSPAACGADSGARCMGITRASGAVRCVGTACAP